MILRAALGAVAVAGLCIGLLGPAVAWPIRTWIGAMSMLLALDLILRADRYKPVEPPGHDDRWKPTGERFFDNESGRIVEVLYDPETGERRYVDARPEAPAPGSRK